MPYAADNIISKAPIEGGIEITDKQYDQARQHTKTGIVKVVDGTMYLASRRPQDAPGIRVEFDTAAGDWSVTDVPKPDYDATNETVRWDKEALDWVMDDVPDPDTEA